MADGFAINAAWLDMLDQYVEGLQADTAAAAQTSAQFLFEEAVDRARTFPTWVNMADNITAWSQDGMLHIGVDDSLMVSEASTIEYGDERRAPEPLLRTMNALVPRVRDRFSEEIRLRRGMG